LGGERIDDLHRGGLRIIQDPELFCFGMDAVLLAHFAEARAGETLLDVGAGTGVIPILLSALSDCGALHGLEIQPAYAALARRSVALNRLENRVFIHEGDITREPMIYRAGQFDAITANPPYVKKGGGPVNPSDAKAVARHEIRCDLSVVIEKSARLLKPNGRFYMVNRPERLADIVVLARKHRLEPKTLRFVQPQIDAQPNLVLLHAVKGAGSMVKVLPAMIVYGPDRTYTPELREIYG